MKKLIFLLLLISTGAYAQKSSKTIYIDSLVDIIDPSKAIIKNDSTVLDKPQYGLYIKTYMTASRMNNKLSKYSQTVYTTRTENGKTDKMISWNTFYFFDDKLIRVKEGGSGKGKEINFDWYFDGDSILYTSMPMDSEKAKNRGPLLLNMAKEILARAEKIRESSR
jgi:hypothetical protein